MADVIAKAKSANAIYNGSAVVYVSKMGVIQVRHPDLNQGVDTTAVEAKYTNRFTDNPNR